MAHKVFCLSIFWFALLSFGVASAQMCPDSGGTFRQNGTYDINRRLVLSYLPSNVTAQGGFYSTFLGQEPNRVYVVGMCIPGVEANDCSKCIESGSDDIMRNCPNQTEAYTWPGEPTVCLIHYSNRSFLGSLNFEPSIRLYNTADLSGNLTEFNRIWEDLASRMIDEAISGEVKTSSSRRNYYAARVANLPEFQTIYALMLCTSDLSPGDCNSCLRKSVGDYAFCCGGKQGGVIARSSCFFRWDLYPYSGAFKNIPAPSPPPSLSPQPPSSTPSPSNKTNTTQNEDKTSSTRKIVKIVAIVVPTVVVILVLVCLGLAVCWRRKSYRAIELGTEDDITTAQSLQFDFKTIEAATDKFSDSNKLGEGGFGEVYKGTFPNGTQIAVKRLSKTSSQGVREFKNEAVLVAKLQHRNLVRLLGFCVEGEEKILVYEFVPNKSLNYFIFDPINQGKLDWTRRYNIIGGIARGLLYLHQDSRLTIIHRDLKASNILLDADMNPKIADFGMAKIMGVEQSRADTSRIVGTYGYMSPEYAMHGQVSLKSDVYSFGIIILEIISGKMNSSFNKTYDNETDDSSGNLVTHVWRLWINRSLLKLVDPAIRESYWGDEVTRCIHIALLCVQEDPADRPTMSTIIMMLTSNTISLPLPRQPGFFLQSRRDQYAEADGLESTKSSIPGSIDDASITNLDPR